MSMSNMRAHLCLTATSVLTDSTLVIVFKPHTLSATSDTTQTATLVTIPVNMDHTHHSLSWLTLPEWSDRQRTAVHYPWLGEHQVEGERPIVHRRHCPHHRVGIPDSHPGMQNMLVMANWWFGTVSPTRGLPIVHYHSINILVA